MAKNEIRRAFDEGVAAGRGIDEQWSVEDREANVEEQIEHEWEHSEARKTAVALEDLRAQLGAANERAEAAERERDEARAKLADMHRRAQQAESLSARVVPSLMKRLELETSRANWRRRLWEQSDAELKEARKEVDHWRSAWSKAQVSIDTGAAFDEALRDALDKREDFTDAAVAAALEEAARVVQCRKHDDRWCPECDTREDIHALTPEGVRSVEGRVISSDEGIVVRDEGDALPPLGTRVTVTWRER